MKALLFYIGILKAGDFCSVKNVEIYNFIPCYKKSKIDQNTVLNSLLTKN